MKKLDKKTIIYIAIGIVAVIVVFLLFKKSKKAVTKTEKGEKDKNNSSNLYLLDSSDFPLKKGSKGKYVKALQLYLNDHKKGTDAPLYIDSKFGIETERLCESILGSKEVEEFTFLSENIDSYIVA